MTVVLKDAFSPFGRDDAALGHDVVEQLYQFAQVVMAAGRVEEVYEAALHAISVTLATDRAAVLTADIDGRMRFRAWSRLSDDYRTAVEGHMPWTAGDPSPAPVLVPDAQVDVALAAYRQVFACEGIGALAFIPLVSSGRLLGKFMVYYPAPHAFSSSDVATACAIANLLASVIARFSAVAELQETIRLNELFAGALAHDLRNPLNAMMTAAQAAAMHAEAGARQGESSGAAGPINQVLTSGRRMARMITQLLDLTVARADGRIEVTPRSASLADLCDDVVSELQTAHPAWQFQRENRGDLRGSWDPDRLLQILSNVIANAGQHGPADGVIRIELDGSSASGARIVVSNSGAIPADILPLVFDPLRRSHRQRKDVRGLGLGLFIVRELVRAHGGSVTIETDPDRSITTVTLNFPRHATAGRVEHLSDRTNERGLTTQR